MKYDCSKEFDLNAIYRKLTYDRNCPKIAANKFFQCDELTLLQQKMERRYAVQCSQAKFGGTKM